MSMIKKIAIFSLFFLYISYSLCAVNIKEPSTDYVFSQLNPSEKVLYSKIGYIITKKYASLLHVPEDSDMNLKCFNAYLDDHPGVFWTDNSITLTITKKGKTTVGSELNFTYSDPAEQEYVSKKLKDYTEEIQQLIKDMDDYNKLLCIYTLLCQNITYNNDLNDQTICSVVKNKEGICAGISKIFQYLSLSEGIDCILCKGFRKNSDGSTSTTPHQWCMVKLNNNWYHIDPTYGLNDKKEFVNYGFFMRSTGSISRTHVIDTEYEIPDAPDDSMAYSRVNGTFIDVYSRDSMLEILKDHINEDENTIMIEFATLKEMNIARSDLFTKKNIFLASLFEQSKYTNVSYITMEEIRTLQITFNK